MSCPCLLCYSHEKDPLFGFLNRLGLVKEVDKTEEFVLGFPNLKTWCRVCQFGVPF